MALNMNGDVVLPADKATVWVKLNDPVVLQDLVAALRTEFAPPTGTH